MDKVQTTWWRGGIVAAFLLPLACLPWRHQKETEEVRSSEFKDWDEFTTLDVKGSFKNLESSILRNGLDLDTFKAQGPMKYHIYENRLMTWQNGRSLVFDNIVPQSASKTPLVILVHGNHSHKEAHRYQAERLASFGIHTVVLQVINQGQWIENGQLIRKLVQKVRKSPSLVGGRIDKRKIILAGHSFGGSAVTVAAGAGAKIRGLILLDPAVVSDGVIDHMSAVTQPTLLLGADQRVYKARRQSEFSRNLGGEFTKVSITGATHDDAQFPSMYSQYTFGYDPFTHLEKQHLFAAALTIGALSLSATGSTNLAADTMAPLVDRGEFLSVEHREKNHRVRGEQMVQERW